MATKSQVWFYLGFMCDVGVGLITSVITLSLSLSEREYVRVCAPPQDVCNTKFYKYEHA